MLRLPVNVASFIGFCIPVILFARDQGSLVNKIKSSSGGRISLDDVKDIQGVTCDSDPCDGEFRYDGPADDPIQAMEVYHDAIKKYSYGGQRGMWWGSACLLVNKNAL